MLKLKKFFCHASKEGERGGGCEQNRIPVYFHSTQQNFIERFFIIVD